MDLFAWILTLSILAGQLVKIPIGTHGGLTLLDITIISLVATGVFNLRFSTIKPIPLWVKSTFTFIFIAIISLIFTPLNLTPLEYFTSFSYIIRFLLFTLVGFLIYQGAFNNLREKIPTILLISGIGLSLLGLVQLVLIPDLRFLTEYGWDPHYFRTASTFLDPNFLGSFLVLTLMLFAHTRSVVNRHLRNIFIVLVYIALLTTFSRGAYLAFLTSFLTLSLVKKSVRFTLITILLFLGLMLGFTTYQRLVAQPRNIDRTQSAELRFNSWQQGWQLFTAHPVLGVGFNAYKYAIRKYNLGDEKFLKSAGSSTNDSSLLYVAATTGIIGFTSYLFLLFSLFKTGWKNHLSKNKWGICLITGLVALLTQSFFANTLFYPLLLIWLISIAAVQKK